MADEAAKKKQVLDAKKAEVRKRLEMESAKKQKKGFMTPERKKKLRLLLRKKAAEELKKEQERKSQERRKIIDQRCGQPKSLEGANEASYPRGWRQWDSVFPLGIFSSDYPPIILNNFSKKYLDE